MQLKLTTKIIKEGKFFVARNVKYSVVSQGLTLEEVRINLSEALELYLNNNIEDEFINNQSY